MKRYLRFLLGVAVAALAASIVKHWPARTPDQAPGPAPAVSYDALYPEAAEAALKARAAK